MIITFIIGNLKDYVMKHLTLLRHLIMELLRTCYHNTNKIRVKFDGDCLKQNQARLLHRGVVNVYIAYEISKTSTSTIISENCLFGAVKVTKNADIDIWIF